MNLHLDRLALRVLISSIHERTGLEALSAAGSRWPVPWSVLRSEEHSDLSAVALAWQSGI